jgi:hypothetical protein
MVTDPERSKALEKARKLIALATSDNENEARAAALMAVRLIQKHNLLDVQEDQSTQWEAIAAETVMVTIAYLLDHQDSIVGLAVALDAAIQRQGATLTPEIRMRLYHRSRWRLAAIVKQGLLIIIHGQGFALPPKVDAKKLRGYVASPVTWV